MPLPDDFAFSQHNLQDYLDCPRRFQLRYLERMAWPAVQSEPILDQERHMQLGEQFHRLVQQHQLGLPVEVLSETARNDTDLLTWWQDYLQYPQEGLPLLRKPEFTLAAPFAGYRLLAKYDLLAIEPGERVCIVDWKTNRKRTPAARLRERVQTRLYPFLMALAGAQFNRGAAWQPHQIEMIYWFTAEPGNPHRIQYSEKQYREDETLLHAWIDAIQRSADQPMLMTADQERQCPLCNYRSFCERGQRAGVWEDESDDLESDVPSIDFDFAQIDEIEF